MIAQRTNEPVENEDFRSMLYTRFEPWLISVHLTLLAASRIPIFPKLSKKLITSVYFRSFLTWGLTNAMWHY